jgi:iron complex outermembrane receptor protein
VTRKPSFEREANFDADYGFDFEEVNLRGFVTGPIGRKVAGSLSAAYRKSEGYVDGAGANEGLSFAGTDNYSIRGKVLFELSNMFRMTFIADSAQNDNELAAVPVTAEGVSPYPFPGVITSHPFTYAGGIVPIQSVLSSSLILDATWDATDWMSIRSISGYREHEGTYQVDIDRTSLAAQGIGLRADQRNFSQEFNFYSASSGTVSWLFGTYFYQSDAGNPYRRIYMGDAPGGTLLSDFTTDMNTRAYAAFGDVTWHTTSQLHVTLGARYTTETKEYRYQDVVSPAPPRAVDAKKSWDSPTYRAVLRYDFSTDANAYLSLSNGFKSGVFNALSPLGIPVDPEEVDALEIGVKAQPSDRLILTAAAYAYGYDDLQVQAHTYISGVPVVTLTNAASAEIRGLEVYGDAYATERLSLGVGVNWMPTAEYTDFPNAAVTVPVEGMKPILAVQISPYDASGSRLIKAPEWMVKANLRYVTSLAGGVFAGNVNYSYDSDFNWQAGGFTKAPSRNLVNARLDWTDSSNRYSVSLWGTNLTDEEYSTYTAPNARGDTLVFMPTRQIGVGFAFRF